MQKGWTMCPVSCVWEEAEQDLNPGPLGEMQPMLSPCTISNKELVCEDQSFGIDTYTLQILCIK